MLRQACRATVARTLVLGLSVNLTACAPQVISLRSYTAPGDPTQTAADLVRGQFEYARFEAGPGDVQLNELYTPDPDLKQLARAWPRDHDLLELVVGFCVDVRGRVEGATVLKESGVEAIDALFVSAVKKWRFKPFLRDGATVASCTCSSFTLRSSRR